MLGYSEIGWLGSKPQPPGPPVALAQCNFELRATVLKPKLEDALSHKTVILVKLNHILWCKMPFGIFCWVLQLLCLNSVINLAAAILCSTVAFVFPALLAEVLSDWPVVAGTTAVKKRLRTDTKLDYYCSTVSSCLLSYVLSSVALVRCLALSEMVSAH